VTYIEELQDVIQRVHGVESRHIESVSIQDIYQGKTLWEGFVEVFEVIGHMKTTKIYAWAHGTSNPERRRHVTVLHIKPITNALLAVRAAILHDLQGF
jgi:hypothetical protein